MESSSTPRDIALNNTPTDPGSETLRGTAKGSPARVGGLTDVGRVREFNEDNLHWEALDAHASLYAVADGMGGHDRGEVASQVAVDTLFEMARVGLPEVSERQPPLLRELMRDFMQSANRAVITKGEEHNSNMGTTLCAALVQKDHAIISNVGDSRVYLMRQGQLIRISQDHSLVGFLETLGELTPAEARTHPSGNILVRSIGSVPEVEVDVFHVETEQGDRILLCSDGLWGEVEDHEIAATLIATEDCQEACVELVDMANDAGGKDNSTLVLITI